MKRAGFITNAQVTIAVSALVWVPPVSRGLHAGSCPGAAPGSAPPAPFQDRVQLEEKTSKVFDIYFCNQELNSASTDDDKKVFNGLLSLGRQQRSFLKGSRNRKEKEIRVFCKNVLQLSQMFRSRAPISTDVGKQMIVLNYQISGISNVKPS